MTKTEDFLSIDQSGENYSKSGIRINKQVQIRTLGTGLDLCIFHGGLDIGAGFGDHDLDFFARNSTERGSNWGLGDFCNRLSLSINDT